MSAGSKIPDLFDETSSAALTPIARELEAYFARGGPVDGAVQFVAALERANKRALPVRRQDQGRGSRLPAEWRPTPHEMHFAIARGLNQERALIEAEKFTNYWTAKVGAGATKRDWSATWRNWIIAAVERSDVSSSYPSSRRSQTGADAVLAGMGRLARAIDERRMPAGARGREVPDITNSPRQLGFDQRTKRTD